MEITHNAPGCFIAKTYGANFPRPDQIAQYRQCFLHVECTIGLRTFITQLTEVVSSPIRPVKVVEVDIICLQTRQACFYRRFEILAIER